ncbi:hypothetical protein JEU11_16400 [Paraglaciecola chathamensis]|uniref:TPR repeat-containing protein n=1 Tax=Paraglaciecola chathamensis TaxID=368405 RepID=A0ABS0WHY9_9ALTE|nr:hypothetical protein [Paraglaciecola chathamensis]MBJ2138045.1 hypothetical protein [Paraglaciecola chathamensis]
MLIKCTLKGLMTFLLTSFYSSVLLGHPEHEATDMLISEYGEIGEVNFATSCEPRAQNTVNVGLALLHHMMYAQAERVFTKQLRDSPNCAMLYWGVSMSLFHPLWPDTISQAALIKGSDAIQKAASLKATSREYDYIKAAAAFYQDWQEQNKGARISKWALAQEQVFANNPQDIDAKALFALALLSTASPADSTYGQQKAAGELLNSIFDAAPAHPGAIHYSIHAYDNPALADMAVDVARAYDKIAPDVPHALHMPSHVFVRLGYWDDVIAWNIRSAKAALNYPTKNETSMHYVHAIDYLVYGYLQSGNVEQALVVKSQMDTHHPVQQNFASAYAFAAIPARIALETHNWTQASQIALQSPTYLDWGAFPQLAAMTHYARAIGAARSNNIEQAEREISALEALLVRTRELSPNYWAILVDAQLNVASAWVLYAKGSETAALAQLRKGADMEDSVDKNPVTPAHVLPAREQLGDMLLLAGKNKAALEAYKANLAINPNRRLSESGVSQALTKATED